MHYVDQLCPHQLVVSSMRVPFRLPGGKASASRAADLGSTAAFAVDLFSGRVIPVP